jgi:hypothetical protein
VGARPLNFTVRRLVVRSVTLRIEHDPAPRAQSEPYRYRIYQGDRLVARYWHDFRGDEHGLEFLDGTSVGCPVGRVTDFLMGGGPEPLRLSTAAVNYLASRLTIVGGVRESR